MKNFLLITIIFILIFSCSTKNEINNEEKNEEFIPLEYKKNYPDDLRITKSSTEKKTIYKDSLGNIQYIIVEYYTSDYVYNENNKLSETIYFRIKRRYSANDDGSIGEEIIPSYYQRSEANIYYTYENDKLISVKNYLHQIITASCYYEYETLFTYNDLNQLESYKYMFKDISNKRDWVEKYSVKCEYDNNIIYREKTINDATYFMNSILLNEYGNFDRYLNENGEYINDYTYDNKNKPSDLISEKNLLGWNTYGSGNTIIANDIVYNHTYNQYNFPAQTIYSYNLKYAEGGTSSSSENIITTIREYNK